MSGVRIPAPLLDESPAKHAKTPCFAGFSSRSPVPTNGCPWGPAIARLPRRACARIVVVNLRVLGLAALESAADLNAVELATRELAADPHVVEPAALESAADPRAVEPAALELAADPRDCGAQARPLELHAADPRDRGARARPLELCAADLRDCGAQARPLELRAADPRDRGAQARPVELRAADPRDRGAQARPVDQHAADLRARFGSTPATPTKRRRPPPVSAPRHVPCRRAPAASGRRPGSFGCYCRAG